MKYNDLIYKFSRKTESMRDSEALVFLALCFLKLVYKMQESSGGILSDDSVNFILGNE